MTQIKGGYIDLSQRQEQWNGMHFICICKNWPMGDVCPLHTETSRMNTWSCYGDVLAPSEYTPTLCTRNTSLSVTTFTWTPHSGKHSQSLPSILVEKVYICCYVRGLTRQTCVIWQQLCYVTYVPQPECVTCAVYSRCVQPTILI